MQITSQHPGLDNEDGIGCHTCKRPILKKDHQSMQIMKDLYFHEWCLKCSACLRLEEKSDVKWVDNQMFCLECYQNCFASMCKKCNEPIVNEAIISINDHDYHPECYKCTKCESMLDHQANNGIFQDKMYCPTCLESEMNTVTDLTCDLCHFTMFNAGLRINHPITGQKIDCHPGHFRCEYCLKKLDHLGNIINNKAMCRNCMAKEGLKPCHVCKKVISGRVTRFQGLSFHEEHFNCQRCFVPLANKVRQVYQGEIYCLNCHNDLSQKICAYCDRSRCCQDFLSINKDISNGRSWGINHVFCYACDSRIDIEKMTRDNKSVQIMHRDLCILCQRCIKFYKPATKSIRNANKQLKTMTINNKTMRSNN